MPFTSDQALAYAQNSQRIAGLCMSPYAVEVAKKMLAGEITHKEARDLIIAEARSRTGEPRRDDWNG